MSAEAIHMKNLWYKSLMLQCWHADLFCRSLDLDLLLFLRLSLLLCLPRSLVSFSLDL
jgi:hypothetical protein